jgi:hypothetical protein
MSEPSIQFSHIASKQSNWLPFEVTRCPSDQRGDFSWRQRRDYFAIRCFDQQFLGIGMPDHVEVVAVKRNFDSTPDVRVSMIPSNDESLLALDQMS